MENKVNQRVIEFLKFKNISKNRFCDMVNVSYTNTLKMIICFHAVLSPEKLHVEKSII